MRKQRRSWAQRLRTATVALLPAVVIASMLVMSHAASASPTSDDTVSVSATPSPDPNLTLSKTADSGSVVAGNPIGFTITLTHSGDGSDTTIGMTDTIPTAGGKLTWSIASASGWDVCALVGGTFLSCQNASMSGTDTAVVHVTSPTTIANCDPAISDVINEAFYTATNAAGGPASDGASAETIVTCPPGHLTLTKVADNATVSAGDPIAFTITAGNDGGASIGPVLVNDTLPTGSGLSWSIDPTDSDCSITTGVLSCDFGSLDAGASHSVRITSPTSPVQCPNGVDNTASADIGANGGAVYNLATPNVDDLTTAHAHIDVLCPFLTVTKTPDLYQGVGGKKMSWTIVVSNTGTGVAHNVVITDSPLPPGGPWNTDDPSDCLPLNATTDITCTIGDLLPGHSVTIHVSGVLSSISDCEGIRNAVEVTADNNGEVTSSTSSNVRCPNVSVVKTAEFGTVQHPTRGFAIVVSSTGNAAVKNVKLTDPLASGGAWSITGGNGKSKCHIKNHKLTCSFGTMTAGKSFTVHIKVVQKVCSTIWNTATVSASNEPSFESGDDSSTADVGCLF